MPEYDFLPSEGWTDDENIQPGEDTGAKYSDPREEGVMPQQATTSRRPAAQRRQAIGVKRLTANQQLECYQRMVPGLWKADWKQYYAACPFCGQKDVLSVYRDQDGDWRWWCRAHCDGSLIESKEGRIFFGGDLRDLRRLVLASHGDAVYDGVADELQRRLAGDSNGLIVGLACLEHARRCQLSLAEPFGCSYGKLAEYDDRLGWYQEDGSFVKDGRRIRSGIVELVKVGLRTGSAVPRPGMAYGVTLWDFADLVTDEFYQLARECEDEEYDPFAEE